MRKQNIYVGCVGVLLIVFAGAWFFLLFNHHSARAGISDNISGWAWSDAIGWVSFNCLDTGTCGAADYGVAVDPGTGFFSGYAWSDSVGWIWFAPTDTPPGETGPAPARLNFSSNQVSGWARACLGAANPNCTGGTNPLAGGWDGWIKLRDDSIPYGVSRNAAPNPDEFEGWAWGGEVVGWLSFNSVTGGGAPHAVVFTGSGIPSADFTCSHSPCETWRKRNILNPILTLINTSTDPEGVGDISQSTWRAVNPPPTVWGSCAGACNHTVQLRPLGTYSIGLEVTDGAGNTDTFISPTPVVIRQDIEADFECSADGSSWEVCAGMAYAANAPLYVRDTSIPSEGSALDDSLTVWTFLPDGNPMVETGVSITNVVFPTNGTKTLTLQVTDAAGRTDEITYTINTILTLPRWREISPF